jgi:poly(3-hydroxybutyrate) depolymerase
MIYYAYHAQAMLSEPARRFAAAWGAWLDPPERAADAARAWRRPAAALRLLAGAAITHSRPAFGITSIMVGNREVAVREEAVRVTPFATLLRFTKDIMVAQPRVLVVAPMSGHFATLLRGTVRTLLADHDVYITDWHNARDVPPRQGRFDLDDFIAHIMDFLRAIGPGGHVLAVCQPTVPVLAAVALMAADRDPAQPRTMTLMAGPIDTRANPTKVNELAKANSLEWFERNMVSMVPPPLPGAFRRVYPGFVQLIAFMSMNLERHRAAFQAYYQHLVDGDAARAAAHRAFYDEYLAVMDLPAEFYLQTVQKVFQDHDLPLGKLTWHGQRVRPDLIRRTALLTVEGERDDICAVGQTMAALDLCSGIRVNMRSHHLQTGVGHYGVFSGTRWTREVYPKVRQMIQITN